VTTQDSKALALSAGARNTYEQLTPQISEADCEARINPSTQFALQAWVARVFAFCFPRPSPPRRGARRAGWVNLGDRARC